MTWNSHARPGLLALGLTLTLALPVPLAGQADDALDGDDLPLAESPGPPVAAAVLRTAPLTLDGRLDDPAWRDAPVITGFVQKDPVEGAPAEERTEVRVLFDSEALYVAARMYDSDPSGIGRQLVRRDGRGSYDFFELSLDPNLDRRTGYRFRVMASGSRGDSYLFDDTRNDDAWDPVWESEVRVDSAGWTAEIRIPLSQIRYQVADTVQTWGVNFSRHRVASNERTFFSLESDLREGTVSQFGLLRGVRMSEAPRRVEVRPYVLSSFHTGPSEEGDPFFDGDALDARVGLEARYGLGSSFTLDATVNPDFGQVEADPAVINLSAFETFFEERRPFFVEDAQVFNFTLSGRENRLFHSRRIGREPQGHAPARAKFTDIPDQTTILGAAKLTGRTTGGLSMGVLAAVTGAESGRAFFDDGERTDDFRVEPRTEYGVISLSQDLRGGDSQVGGIFTVLRRDLPGDGTFDFLPSEALSAGLDFEHRWGNREWALTGFFAGSHVRGSAEAIEDIQRSSTHYFQRPDATWVELDPTRTSLTGAEWRLQFERQSGEHWTGGVWIGEITPDFEINDLGFSRSSEKLDAGARIGYREVDPGEVFRSYRASLFTFHNWSHEALNDPGSFDSWGRAHTSGHVRGSFNATLLNYWDVNLDMGYSPELHSRTATRGGPVMLQPSSVSGGFRFNTDRRNALSLGLSGNYARSALDGGSQLRTGVELEFRPSPSLELEIEPSFRWQTNGDQYVTTIDAAPYAPTFGSRYIFGELEQQTFSMETRVSWAFTPSLTLQVFAQPLLSSGDYVRYRQLAAPETFDFVEWERGELVATEDGTFCRGGRICAGEDVDGALIQHVDADGDGATDFSFGDRNFNVRSLVGNAVLRWEYRPGSTLFFVWQQQRRGRADAGDFDFRRDADALFAAPADNVFIVKANFWLGL